jgi:lipopolysaccharide transport system permease protein
VPSLASESGDCEPTGWTENRPSRGWFPRFEPRALWSYRGLALALALRDLRLRYTQTALGVAWAILQPLAGVVVFTIIFGRLANLPSDGVPYAVFVYAGLALWFYFSNAVEAAAESLVGHSELVTKVYFPRVLAPFAAILPGLIDLVISLVILAGFMTIYGVAPDYAVGSVPRWIGAAVFITLGVGLWMSALNALYRDVRYALGFLLQLAFFASPVIFPTSLFEGRWLYVYSVNPMVGVLDGFRWSLLDTRSPGLEALVSLGAAVLVFAGGLAYFCRVERRIADMI